MSFIWVQSITQYTNLEAVDVQEIRNNADWLDSNIAYCATNYTTYRLSHYTSVRTTHNATYNSANYKSPSCFAKDCIVKMFDGSDKLIQDIKIGEFVLGAYGDKNEVLYFDRPLREDRIIWDINGLYTTDEHSIMNGNRNGFSYINLQSWKNDIQRHHIVIDNNYKEKLLFLSGVRENFTKIEQLRLGSKVAIIGGHKIITKINPTNKDDKLLYNLVLSGSHTYCVNGIFVGGFVNDLDFDYISGIRRN